MNRAEQVLAASKKAFARREEERAFGDRSEDVRAWEPEPTRELAASFRPKAITGMYETIRTIMDEGPENSGEKISKFRTYS
jgi:hypothetical protein